MKENKELKYLKTWNSDNTLQIIFSKLTDDDKNKLFNLLKNTYETFYDSSDPDVFYSIFLHVLSNKIEFGIDFPKHSDFYVQNNNDPLKSW